jgi:hypothetical protein
MESKTHDNTVTLALLSAGAYACAFAFDGGYLGHFGVPTQFVDVNLRGVLLSVAALVGTSVFAFSVAIGHLPAVGPSPLRNLVIRTAVVYLFMAAMSFALSGSMTLTLVLATALMAPEWVLPAVRFRGRGMSFNEKITAQRNSEKTTFLETSLMSARETSPRVTATILLLIVAVMVAWTLGGWYARRQTEFLISKDCIALRIEDKTLLCARWDGALTGEYEYRAAEGVVLSMERVGPLPRYRHQLLRPAVQRPADEPQVVPETDMPIADTPDAASNTQADTPPQ